MSFEEEQNFFKEVAKKSLQALDLKIERSWMDNANGKEYICLLIEDETLWFENWYDASGFFEGAMFQKRIADYRLNKKDKINVL